jgi:hypothetical protein
MEGNVVSMMTGGTIMVYLTTMNITTFALTTADGTAERNVSTIKSLMETSLLASLSLYTAYGHVAVTLR